jgi:hypothetical protein
MDRERIERAARAFYDELSLHKHGHDIDEPDDPIFRAAEAALRAADKQPSRAA